MIPPLSQAEISLRFYQALDGVERTCTEIARLKPEMEEQCRDFVREMERVADQVLDIAVNSGWGAAHDVFMKFRQAFEAFAKPYS